MTLRARALEAAQQAEEQAQAGELAHEAAERRRRWERLRALLTPLIVTVPEGADTVTVEGLRLVVEPSRYGLVVAAGATCRECSAFARLASVSELRSLGTAYRALEGLGDAPPCHLVGPECGRRRLAVDQAAPAFASEGEAAIFAALEGAEASVPEGAPRATRLRTLAAAVALRVGEVLEAARRDRALGDAVRAWLGGEIEGR